MDVHRMLNKFTLLYSHGSCDNIKIVDILYKSSGMVCVYAPLGCVECVCDFCLLPVYISFKCSRATDVMWKCAFFPLLLSDNEYAERKRKMAMEIGGREPINHAIHYFNLDCCSLSSLSREYSRLGKSNI